MGPIATEDGGTLDDEGIAILWAATSREFYELVGHALHPKAMSTKRHEAAIVAVHEFWRGASPFGGQGLPRVSNPHIATSVVQTLLRWGAAHGPCAALSEVLHEAEEYVTKNGVPGDGFAFRVRYLMQQWLIDEAHRRRLRSPNASGPAARR